MPLAPQRAAARIAAVLLAPLGVLSTAAAEPFVFAPIPGLERAEAATALALDARRGRLAVGDARGVWIREADGRVRRALGSGPVHDLAFSGAGELLAATERGLYEITPDRRVRRRSLGPGGASRARRIALGPVGTFVATDDGVLAAVPGAGFRPLDGALPGGETQALAWDAGGGRAGTLHAILAGDLYAVALALGPGGLEVAGFRREPLADRGGPPLDLTLRAPDARPVLLRQRALATLAPDGWQSEPLVLPPGLEPLRVAWGPAGVWIATDAGLVGAIGAEGPFRRAVGSAGGAASTTLLVAGERVVVATVRGVFEGARLAPGERGLDGGWSARGEGGAPPPLDFTGEPPVEAVHRVALRYLDLGRGRLASLERRVRRRGFLPELEIAGDYRGFRASDEDHDQTVFSSGNRYQLLDRSHDHGRDFAVGAKLSWDLGRALYDPEEIDVSREVRELIELRDEVLDEVNQLYFERRRVLLERVRLAEPESLEGERLRLRANELAAGLDAWTGGWWSQQLRSDPNSPPSHGPEEVRP